MPGLAKKLLVFAAVDGLLLQPANLREHGVRVEYGTNRVVSSLQPTEEGPENGLEVHGIVGLLDLVTSKYLIATTRREQVASVRENLIFKITDVALIPLKSKEEAEKAIVSAKKVLQQSATKPHDDSEDSDVGEDVETSTIGSVDSVDKESQAQKAEPQDEAAALEPPKSGALKKSTTFVKDVVQEKGKYGRFASRWFSRNGGKEAVKRQEGMLQEQGEGLTKEQEKQVNQVLPDTEAERTPEDGKKEETEVQSAKPETVKPNAIEYLTPRILKSARLYFSSGFYFSYDYDISQSLAKQGGHTKSLPLWKRFDPLFFWNRHLMEPFIDAGQDFLIIPYMQGFVGQRAFTIEQSEGDETDIVAEARNTAQEQIEMQNVGQGEKEESSNKHDFLLTLISRRSIKRAGLRYLRRGVDDEGNVANSVETEQILSPQSQGTSGKTFSLLQVRGSMPLFFSQSPYSFKPVPVMFGSERTNQAAFKRHFQTLTDRYGDVQAASLVDKHGTEMAIGEAYEKHAKHLDENGGITSHKVDFEWFDFHHQCKGMNFQNVHVLLDTLQGSLGGFGWSEEQTDSIIRKQNGILRTNCMDCLDRTNVVQSAVAGWALQQQINQMGLTIDLSADLKTRWFNTLWADNGDAISKQYAGTSALKGDFTRTRKRNWTGALSDFSLTLNRYYNNIFGDYFVQTCIDYFLGNAGPSIFDSFESDMTSNDNLVLDISNIRQNAIDTCVKIVLEQEDHLLAGWALSAPNKSNTLRALPFEECVLLLTDSALYFCRFDWETEKVGSFERVDLLDILDIWRGAYITSALGGTHLDDTKNVGFALRYENKGPSTVRTNTRSMSVAEGIDEAKDDTEKNESKGKASNSDSRPDDETILLAFKALPPKAAAGKDHDRDLSSMNEADTTKHITEEIHKALSKAWQKDRGFQHIEMDKPPQVQERDVISVSEAKRSTGYLEGLSYNLKRLVWS